MQVKSSRKLLERLQTKREAEWYKQYWEIYKKKQYWEIYINITEKYTKNNTEKYTYTILKNIHRKYWEIYKNNTEKYIWSKI